MLIRKLRSVSIYILVLKKSLLLNLQVDIPSCSSMSCFTNICIQGYQFLFTSLRPNHLKVELCSWEDKHFFSFILDKVDSP